MRHTIAAADSFLDVSIPVLDHGFVMLKDYMGSDDAIVEAARISTDGVGVRKKTENEGLIRYLMGHAHTSPFEMVELKFHCMMPIFVARQWIRHRTANVNEMSGRYSQLPELVYIPDEAQISYQSPKNKQGRGGGGVSPEIAKTFRSTLREEATETYGHYREFLGNIDQRLNLFSRDQYDEIVEGGGISRELARINLPLSTYTQWYWKIDLHNLFHFLQLRLDEHAQWEIREYAKVIADIVKALCPIAWQAFEDYRLMAMRLSKPEVEAIAFLLSALPPGTLSGKASRLSKREAEELRGKLIKLGLEIASQFKFVE
jgi:thymidylate synthase (FAD)